MFSQIYNFFSFFLAHLRAFFWSFFVSHMGKGVYIQESCKLYYPQGIKIGDYSGINHHTDIGGRGGLTIGNYVMIGPYCQILTAEHETYRKNIPIAKQDIICKPVIIEDDVWIG